MGEVLSFGLGLGEIWIEAGRSWSWNWVQVQVLLIQDLDGQHHRLWQSRSVRGHPERANLLEVNTRIDITWIPSFSLTLTLRTFGRRGQS